MSLDTIKERIPDYAKDIRINIGRILTEQNSKGLSQAQIYGLALATAYATENQTVINDFKTLVADELKESEINGIKSAVSIMAMNNVYYRTIGMLSDKTISQLQTGLRMQVIGKPGIDQVNFELYSLGVSAVNGCTHCVDSHAKKLIAEGLSHEAIQATIRIASVIKAIAQVIQIEGGH